MKNTAKGAMSNRTTMIGTLAALMLIGITTGMNVQASNTGPTTSYYLQSLGGESAPPLPFNPYPGLATTLLPDGGVLINDLQFAAARSLLSASAEPPVAPDGDGGSTNSDPGPVCGPLLTYGTDDLWLELTAMDGYYAYLTLHGTKLGTNYQLLSTTNLAQPTTWTRGEIVQDVDGTNGIVFYPVNVWGQPMMFFRARVMRNFLSISGVSDAVEPYPTALGWFDIIVSNTCPNNLTVYYQVSGTASNGITYTNLSGSAVISVYNRIAPVFVHPLPDDTIRSNSTVTLTLLPADGYVVDPLASSATISIIDNPFHAVSENLGPDCYISDMLEYHPSTHSFILAVNWPSGEGTNFIRIDTNNVVHQWTDIQGVPDQVNMVVVKALGSALTNAGGFTNGDIYFSNGSPGGIGWMSADGSRNNLNWLTLANETNYIRGGLYFDQSGSFGGDLIVVTGDANIADSSGYPDMADRGVWRVHSDKVATRIAAINTRCLEGAVTLTNDPAQWGPWAGSIITGDELAGISGLVYSVTASGTVTTNDLGIAPQDFNIIPANQDFYILEPYYLGAILKVSSNYFAGHVGDLLMTQESGPLLIVHWDAANNSFTTNAISYPTWVPTSYPPFYQPVDFESGRFAPVQMPFMMPQ
jgi:hypothetical protein